jgi:hypothetical protein
MLSEMARWSMHCAGGAEGIAQHMTTGTRHGIPLLARISLVGRSQCQGSSTALRAARRSRVLDAGALRPAYDEFARKGMG